MDIKSPRISIISGLAFLYIFIQLNVTTAISHQLSHLWHLNAIDFGFFSSTYLMGVAFFVIPAGILIDRYGPYKQVIIGLFISLVCTLILANSNSLYFISTARFIGGMFHSLVFVSCIRITSNHYRLHRAAYIGLTITIGLIGGIITQYPFISLAKHIGWHQSLNTIAFGGFIITGVLLLSFRRSIFQAKKIAPNSTPLKFTHITQVLKNYQNFIYGLYACAMDFPSITVGANWGNRYIKTLYHYSAKTTSEIIPWLFIGLMVGSPISGWLSDHLKMRKSIMLIAALFLFILTILWGGISASFSWLIILTFMIGFLSGFQVLSYTCISESNPHEHQSLAISYISIIIMGGNGLLMPLIGWLMSLFPSHPYYSLLIIPSFIFISIVLMLIFVSESFQPIEKCHA